MPSYEGARGNRIYGKSKSACQNVPGIKKAGAPPSSLPAETFQARQQLGKFLLRFLLRCDLCYTEGTNWTKAHLDWVRRLPRKDETIQSVLDDYLLAVESATQQVERFTNTLES